MEATYDAQWCRFFMEICALLGGAALALSLLYEVALPALRRRVAKRRTRRFAAWPKRGRRVTEP
ncbi:MAG: hypothetical protein SOV63_03695 [Pyramidobacter porci]|uniref:hypothetical protein n=1 Tax=Pyramidobacter porci TaxID=2605789 RepID=UPI002A7537F6|nr:hypothetical protein [Pyramidobacter porci]MCI6261506.1 hypothetical protein [Pyramidobacter sp.]MDY2647891.1 hypothetical protein [Pyramidobacter porci]